MNCRLSINDCIVLCCIVSLFIVVLLLCCLFIVVVLLYLIDLRLMTITQIEFLCSMN